MSNKATVYIVQNENHAINFSLDAKGKNNIFIYLDNLTGLSSFSSNVGEVENAIFLGKEKTPSFYRTNLINKLNIIYRVKKEIHSKMTYLSDFNELKIIIGNDGSLQKLIIYEIKKKLAKNCHFSIELWIDSLIMKRKRSLKKYTKEFVSKIAHNFSLSYLFPSEYSKFPLIDCFYVADEVLKNTLVANGIEAEKIKIKNFPRGKYLLNKFASKDNIRERLLFISSAWTWHGRASVERWQKKVIEDLIELKERKLLDADLFIRNHPRQSKESTSSIPAKYLSKNKSFEEDIVNSTIIISFRSSALYDAKVLGKTVLVYEEKSPFHETNDFIETLTKIRNLIEINKYLN